MAALWSRVESALVKTVLAAQALVNHAVPLLGEGTSARLGKATLARGALVAAVGDGADVPCAVIETSPGDLVIFNHMIKQ